MEMATRIHIIVFPFPVQGHINPMLQFAKRLASKGTGIKVTLVTTTSSTSSNSIQLAESSSVNIESIYDGVDEGEKIESFDLYLERFKVAIPRSLAEFIQSIKKQENKLVLVYDSVIPWALDIARQLGVYGASFFTQSCAVCAIYYHVNQGSLLNINPHRPQGRQGIAAAGSSSSMVSVPSVPVLLGINDLPSFICDTDSYPFLLTIVLDQFSNFHKADWLLFNTFDKLEREVVNWMSSRWPMIKTVGPTIPSMYLDKRLEDDRDYGLNLFKPDAEACMKWLESKESRSVVYVSFGSLANLGELQMEELAWGLLMSNTYFLWVVRASEQSKLPSNFMGGGNSKGLVVNWCPQLEVLAHRAVGCFVTHCGWNSTLEALSLGVPMVAMPQWTDQATNAKCIVDVWHAGVRVRVDNEKGLVSRDEFELCIRQVMEGEKGNELRKNAVRWKELAKEAVHEGGSSDNNIEEFVSELVST
ncbi:UDP-glycosyltransferase 74E2-like [Cornus florida]|uniref:UDP-glycosyltransferase 74E2-like n=1 Tax=Cornus florida TaxID=4283 RepID=UPI0028A11CA6|nr:UDP-glycosyltransferase 74E2-like [Cornus florida]